MLPVEPFLEQLKSEHAAKKTLAFYGGPVRKFAAFCIKPLDQVIPADVYAFADFVRQDGNTDYSTHNHVRAVKYFLKRSGVELKIKLPSFTPPAPEEYQPIQLKQLFASATESEIRLFKFYLCTGCREQEVAHATWDCLNEHEFTVKAHPEWGWNPKKFKTRVIPIPDALFRLLEPVRKTGLIFPNIHGRPDGHHLKKLHHLVRRSEQDTAEFWLHKFRCTFATTHLRNGATVHEVAGWLGHSDLDTVMRYLALASGKSERVRGLANSAFGGI